MVFTIHDLKYDTDKMELISRKCEYSRILSGNIFHGKDVKLYKRDKNSYLLTYSSDYDVTGGIALSEHEVRELLMQYDLEAYETLFENVEKA